MRPWVGPHSHYVVARQVAMARVRELASLCIDTPRLRKYTGFMATTTTAPRRQVREPRVSRTYRLPLTKLKAAQRALGAATATETIERALDMVMFQRELVRGTRAMLGVEIAPADPTE